MTTPSVTIIDSGGANIASVLYAFERLGVTTEMTTDAGRIQQAERVLLPGVGAAGDAMTRLRHHGLVEVIQELQQPVLGICLGMQLLADASEEEDVECLGVIPGVATKFPATTSCPVPNMGWCAIERTNAHPLLRGIDSGSYFYFVHSYALPVCDHTIASAQHARPFSAILSHNNFVAAQFHPERSSKLGARLLKNFIGLPT